MGQPSVNCAACCSNVQLSPAAALLLYPIQPHTQLHIHTTYGAVKVEHQQVHNCHGSTAGRTDTQHLSAWLTLIMEEVV